MADNETDDFIMLSALRHYEYCPRSCALIHLEQSFEENLYTLRGRVVHEQVDEPEGVIENDVRVERALPLWNNHLGLIGKADAVEFHGDTPYPVEYKHGPRRPRENEDLQLCAQALCLEEMTGKPVPKGAIFHHSSRRRREVEFTPDLRAKVEQTAQQIRLMLAKRTLPLAVNDARCKHCSLQDSCLPSVTNEKKRLQRLASQLFTVIET